MNRKLTNPNATAEAVRLYDYLCSLNGRGCLTGQMESGWCGTHEHEINYLLIRHGREVCQAKKPNCAACAVFEKCQNGKL